MRKTDACFRSSFLAAVLLLTMSQMAGARQPSERGPASSGESNSSEQTQASDHGSGAPQSGARESEPLDLPSPDDVKSAVLVLEALRDLDDLSRELWPDWRISETAFALHGGDGGFCILVNHPEPPQGFEQRRTFGRSRSRFHVCPSAAVDPSSGEFNGKPTAFICWSDFEDGALPAAFESAFRCYLLGTCPDLNRLTPPVDGYPLTPENLALADIECEILADAAAAPDDSLEQRMLEFVSVRNYRRMRMSSAAAEAYESRLEQCGGLPAYVRERARLAAPAHLQGEAGELLDGALGAAYDGRACLLGHGGLEWYRTGRYRPSGMVLCGVLDRLMPGWREEVGECVDPYDALYERVLTRLPKALGIVTARELHHRIAEREEYIESLKTGPERLYESIVDCDGPKLVVNTSLLQSTSVSYDPENMEEVDEHRMVHKRVLKIEFSGGTRVHVLGVQSAVTMGDGEFDIQQLTVQAPERYAVTIGGRRADLSPGVHEFDEPLSLAGEGLLIEARTGVIMVGEDKMTFVLHR